MTDRTYTAGDAAIAAGVNVNTLRSWLQRGVIPIAYDELVEVNGSSHRLKYETVEMIAVTAALVKVGFSPSRAGLLGSLGTNVYIDRALPVNNGVQIVVDFDLIKRRVAAILNCIDDNDINADGSPAMGEIVA